MMRSRSQLSSKIRKTRRRRTTSSSLNTLIVSVQSLMLCVVMNELKKHHKHQEQFNKISENVDEVPNQAKMRMRSSSFNSEPIVEEDEAGNGETDDPLHHHFRVSRTLSLFGKKRKS